MTVSSTPRVQRYNGSGSTGPFTFNFRVLDATHIRVTKYSASGSPTVLTNPSGYSVTLVSGGVSGGQVTLVSALAVGETLVIEGVTPITQGTPFGNQGAFYASFHEDAFDKAVINIQEQALLIGRGIVISSLDDESTIDLALPPISANKAVVTNAAGDGFDLVAFANLAAGIDVTLTGLAANDVLQYNGTAWVNKTLAATGLPTLTGTNSFTGANSFVSNIAIAGNSTQAGFITLGEDTDNGTHVLKIQAAAAMGADRTLTAPDASGTIALTSDLPTTYSTITAATSAGINLQTNGASDVLLLGAGGSVNATLYGNLSMNTANKIVNCADPSSAQDVATKAYVDAILIDEDNMASDSAVKAPTQQSVKAYVDNNSAQWTYVKTTLADDTIDLATGIPSGVSEIEIFFADIERTTTDTTAYVRIGDSGGIETSGYVSTLTYNNSTSAIAPMTTTSGFLIADESVSFSVLFGATSYMALRISKIKDDEFTYALNGMVLGTGFSGQTLGFKTLTSEITSINLVSVNSSGAWTGTAYVRYR